ncbi:STM3941 family protein [Flavobacterium sp. J27]|uniref:STM3941 family protein n=1 Tax=Flavobacterium sp. J27 TaxID=2060419 RepID=UPI0010308C41|nr:STM3941 family protein [Flavobacterium sp. J27]
MEKEAKIFHQNKLKSFFLFIISLLFVCGGIFITKEKTWLGWSIILFFGLSLIVSIIQFFPNATYLKLDDEGFEVKTLFRSSFTKWSEVTNFRRGNINGNKMIFFDFTEEHTKWKNEKKMAKLLSGMEGAIQSTYTISTEDLLHLMMDYKMKSLSKNS